MTVFELDLVAALRDCQIRISSQRSILPGRNIFPRLTDLTMKIDEECEKAMIQFVYHHRISRMVDFDAVWREFLRIYPLPEIDVSDLKTHYLCMDRGSNKWGLSEDAFLYFKFGSHAEEMDLNAGPEESGGNGKRAHLMVI